MAPAGSACALGSNPGAASGAQDRQQRSLIDDNATAVQALMSNMHESLVICKAAPGAQAFQKVEVSPATCPHICATSSQLAS